MINATASPLTVIRVVWKLMLPGSDLIFTTFWPTYRHIRLALRALCSMKVSRSEGYYLEAYCESTGNFNTSVFEDCDRLDLGLWRVDDSRWHVGVHVGIATRRLTGVLYLERELIDYIYHSVWRLSAISAGIMFRYRDVHPFSWYCDHIVTALLVSMSRLYLRVCCYSNFPPYKTE